MLVYGIIQTGKAYERGHDLEHLPPLDDDGGTRVPSRLVPAAPLAEQETNNPSRASTISLLTCSKR
jgi:hypothetical protein